MKLLLTLLASIVVLPTLAFAGEPVNSTCPFSGKAVNPEITTTVGEVTVGFCCNGCVGGFKKWDTEKQLAYIAEQKGEPTEPTEMEPATLAVTTPYLLSTCPISGAELGSMGDPVIEVIKGREVRFCCGGCISTFKKDSEAKFAKIDKLMIEQQLPYYPLATCVISGENLDDHAASVDFIYGNRLFRLCCNDCKDMFDDNPSKWIPELDEAIIKKQKKTYPLTTCVIGKGPLGGMGEPDYFIVGNRLVQLCCGGCRNKVLKDPLAAFAQIDAATQ